MIALGRECSGRSDDECELGILRAEGSVCDGVSMDVCRGGGGNVSAGGKEVRDSVSCVKWGRSERRREERRRGAGRVT